MVRVFAMPKTMTYVVVCEGLRAVEKPYAMDTQSEDPPQDDLQSATSQLPEVPVPVLHGPGAGAAPARQPRVGDQ